MVGSSESTNKHWPTLPWRYSYRADVVLRNTDNESEAYFFLGTLYTLLDVHSVNRGTLFMIGLPFTKLALIVLSRPFYLILAIGLRLLLLGIVQRRAFSWMAQIGSLPASTRISRRNPFKYPSGRGFAPIFPVPVYFQDSE